MKGLKPSAGDRGGNCFTEDLVGGKLDTALKAAAATAVAASDLRVFSFAGGKERAVVAARWSTALR